MESAGENAIRTPPLIFWGLMRRSDGLARAEEGSGEESARASAFLFLARGNSKCKHLAIKTGVCYDVIDETNNR